MNRIFDRSWRLLITLLVIFSIPARPAPGARAALPNPYLVADLNPLISQHSFPHPFMPAGPLSYFFTFNLGHKSWDDRAPRLYQTDGTPQGTHVVKYFGPGDQGSFDQFDSAMYGGLLFFGAYDPEHGFGLWRTDGSEQGTQLVAYVGPVNNRYVYGFTVFQEKLFFVARDGVWYLEDPDGQPQPLVTRPVNYGSFTPPIIFGDKLYFPWDDPQHGTELWESDGTPAGTHFLKDLYPGVNSSIPTLLLVHQNTLYFSAQSGQGGFSLWAYRQDQNQFTQLPSIVVNTGFIRLVAAGDWVYFRGYNAATGDELYQTDGLTAQKVLEIYPGSGSSSPFLLGAVSISGQPAVLFFATESNGQEGLWSSDGTAIGTNKVVGPLKGFTYETAYLNGKYYLGADDGIHGIELWQTDGTPGGTSLLMDLLPGSEGSFPNSWRQCGSRLCFFANDGVHGLEPWSTDGTPGGTQLLVDANQSPADSDPHNPLAAGGKLYFSATIVDSMNVENGGLYRTGPAMDVERLHSDLDLSSYEVVMAALGSQVFYLEKKYGSGYNLWWINGPDQAPLKVKTLDPLQYNPLIKQLLAFNNKVYFAYDKALWYSNGLPEGTQVLRTFAYPINFMTVFNNLLVLDAYNSLVTTNQTSLYATNGSALAPTLLGQLSGYIFSSAQTDQRLFLGLTTGTLDRNMLAQVNGGSPMTVQQVPAPACLGSYGLINRLTALGSTLFFYDLSADKTRLTLLKTTGAQDGVACVWSTALPAGAYYQDDRPMTTFQGKVLFDAPGANGARQVWMSDGTAQGTLPLPGQGVSAPGLQAVSSLLAAPTGLFFNARTPARGSELWFWDGSQPPRLASDVRPGAASSAPELMLVDNGLLYFVANDGLTGRELWAFDTAQIPPVTADFYVDPFAGIAPLAVQFTAEANGFIETYAWDFGDGTTSSEENPAHTFLAAGQYPVTLQVSGDGGVDEITKTVTVYERVLADFSLMPGSGTVPLEVQFNHQSTGSYTSVNWDFGDGTTSSEPNPLHTFLEPGSYLVQLTVSGSGGIDHKTSMLIVDHPHWNVYLPCLQRTP